MSVPPTTTNRLLTSPLRAQRMQAATKANAGELSPELTAASMSASTSASSQRDKEKASNFSEDESEEVIKKKKKHISRTKDSSDDSNSASTSSSSSSNTDAPTLLNDPIAYAKSVERGTWVRLALLMLTLAVLFFAWHPTAYYRTQLYFGQCVEIPGRGGMIHKICPPSTIPHPLA